MKITDYFELNKTQAEINFVDVNVKKDLPLFIDPHFLSHREDAWSVSATSYIRSFFDYLLDLIRNDEIDQARELFRYLADEPDETCLGLSSGEPHGRSINQTDIDTIFRNLVSSVAAKTGLVEHLQDAIIFVDGVGKDKLSDITTCIIRKKLIEFTQSQCALWGLPLTEGVPTGFYWDPVRRAWVADHTEMLVVDGKKILLVPKGIVSFCDIYTPYQYHQFFVLNFLQNEHLRLGTALVKKRENKQKKTVTHYVTKDDLKEKVSPGDKEDLRQFTLKHPAIFRKFQAERNRPARSLKNTEIADVEISDVALHLRRQLVALPTGAADASVYEDLIKGLLELLLYPDLQCPQGQVQIHQGRKRIDITFDNAAQAGSFFEFHARHGIPCPYIMVECKNYTKDVNNPELDQLAGRFSPNRGKVGLLVFRSVADMGTLIDRCIDNYRDDRGLIIPLSDEDLLEGLNNICNGILPPLDQLLRDRARQIQMG